MYKHVGHLRIYCFNSRLVDIVTSCKVLAPVNKIVHYEPAIGPWCTDFYGPEEANCVKSTKKVGASLD